MTEHEPGCPLRGVPWLESAAPQAPGDLAVALESLPDLDVWADAGLSAALRRVAPPESDHRLVWCTCGHG